MSHTPATHILLRRGVDTSEATAQVRTCTCMMCLSYSRAEPTRPSSESCQTRKHTEDARQMAKTVQRFLKEEGIQEYKHFKKSFARFMSCLWSCAAARWTDYNLTWEGNPKQRKEKKKRNWGQKKKEDGMFCNIRAPSNHGWGFGVANPAWLCL